ncbi:MAG: hypothetical protein RLZZ435_3649 [Cyanobacteriota bacterium]|jgi:restriction endonuclease S subunit
MSSVKCPSEKTTHKQVAQQRLKRLSRIYPELFEKQKMNQRLRSLTEEVINQKSDRLFKLMEFSLEIAKETSDSSQKINKFVIDTLAIVQGFQGQTMPLLDLYRAPQNIQNVALVPTQE